MLHEIVTLKDRMAHGGDWRGFRDEIAALHGRAQTEEEFVTLLEAFDLLTAVGAECYPPDVYDKLLPVTRADYKMMLNVEAMEGGNINPVKLERITRREIAAGRLNEDDGLRQLAVDSAAVLGETGDLDAHKCRRGDWLFYGATGSALASLALISVGRSPLWTIPVALIVAYYFNDVERKRIKREIELRREEEENTMRGVMELR